MCLFCAKHKGGNQIWVQTFSCSFWRLILVLFLIRLFFYHLLLFSRHDDKTELGRSARTFGRVGRCPGHQLGARDVTRPPSVCGRRKPSILHALSRFYCFSCTFFLLFFLRGRPSFLPSCLWICCHSNIIWGEPRAHDVCKSLAFKRLGKNPVAVSFTRRGQGRKRFF